MKFEKVVPQLGVCCVMTSLEAFISSRKDSVLDDLRDVCQDVYSTMSPKAVRHGVRPKGRQHENVDYPKVGLLLICSSHQPTGMNIFLPGCW